MLPATLPDLCSEPAAACRRGNFEASIINSYCIVSLLLTYIICNLKTFVINGFILILKWESSVGLLRRVWVFWLWFRIFGGNSYNFFCFCYDCAWLRSVPSKTWTSPTFFLNVSSYLNLFKAITCAFPACDSADWARSLACTCARLKCGGASVTAAFINATTLRSIHVSKLSIAASLLL